MSWWRSLTFMAKGLSNFTKGAYESAAESFSPLEPDFEADGDSARPPSPAGQHVLVTGGNSGIGYAAAEDLVRRGAVVHILCRNEERGNEALEKLKEAGRDAGGDARLHLCDLGETGRVRAFADAYVRSGLPLHALINNAGAMVPAPDDLKDGDADPNVRINLIGTFALTEGLLPALRATADAPDAPRRPLVITVSSGGMYLADLPQDLAERFGDKQEAYSSNKRGQVALSEHWAAAHPALDVYSMHPGWADTPALREAMPDFHRRFEDKLRTPEQATDTLIWAVCRPDELSAIPAGAFLLDRAEQTKHLTLARTHYETADVDRLHANLTEYCAARPPTDAEREQYAYLVK